MAESKTVFELIANNGFTTEDYPYPEVWCGVIKDMGLKKLEYFADHMDPLLFRPVVRDRSKFFQDTVRAIENAGLEVWSGATARVSYLQNMLSHPWPDMRAVAMDWMRAFIDQAVALGAPYISGHYDVIPKPDVERSLHACIDRMCDSLVEVSHYGKQQGLKAIFIEVMHRAQIQPYTIEGARYILNRCNASSSIPVYLHYDVGHSAFVKNDPAHTERDRDIYEWLRTPFGANEMLLVHQQQSDDKASHHWPFTADYNARGIVDGRKCIEAVEESGVKHCVFSIEVLFPRSTHIDVIRRELVGTADYWRKAFAACGYTEKDGVFEKR